VPLATWQLKARAAQLREVLWWAEEPLPARPHKSTTLVVCPASSQPAWPSPDLSGRRNITVSQVLA